MPKYIFVTGGVISGIGKGITAASLGRLLKARGLKVASQKLDPYMNVDPGTLSPFQHGEVFVTDDGIETDLDLGHYERFIDENLNKYSSITSGKVYWNVLHKERAGEYLGETVQVIPHITNEIKSIIYNVGKLTNADVVITEVGGTVGDIESLPFLEAIRQVSLEVGLENCLFVHVTLVPYIISSMEYKTKPTQHSVKELQSIGITPNIIVFRTDEPVEESVFRKIALFCNVKQDCVIENLTVPTLYAAPIEMEKKNISGIVCRELGLETPEPDLREWKAMLTRQHNCTRTVHISLVGKYVKLHDAYLSVAEALKHAGIECSANVDIHWISSEEITDENVAEMLKGCDGIILPGGFGERGIDGMVITARYARENNIPYFGICLGMQISVIEFMRNVCGIADANSTEFDEETANPVICFMPDQDGNTPKGGTMRRGSYPCRIAPNTVLAKAYNTDRIDERHRHRYEFNNDYRDVITQNGMVISGTSPDNNIVETVEVSANRFHIGVQFHPEFKSRPNRPHPLFVAFLKASLNQ